MPYNIDLKGTVRIKFNSPKKHLQRKRSYFTKKSYLGYIGNEINEFITRFLLR